MRYVETLIKKDIWDTETGLVWRRDPEPGAYTFDDALERASQVAEETGQPWRVPTVEELRPVLDYSSCPDFTFPDRYPYGFWSSSQFVDDTYFAWVVYFSDGSVYGYSRVSAFALRLVRNVDGPFNLVQI